MRSVEQLLQGIAVPAGQKLYGVMPGDTVRVSASIDYRGPAWDDVFYAAIGSRVVFFDEYWVGTTPVHFDSSVNWVTYKFSVDILITKIANFPWTPGWFDLYVKLDVAQGKAGFPELSNVIEVLLAAEFQNFAIASYEV
ncbi:unnamed protein product, partial [marine sediment metagenome]